MQQLRLCIFTLLTVHCPSAAQRPGGGGVERVQVTFTPTVCTLRCVQDRCDTTCGPGNATTLLTHSGGPADGAQGFRVFLCPLLCKNGGVCVQKDRCLCPPSFTGKFCQIPVPASSSTNEIIKPPPASLGANQELTQSEYLVPLQSQPIGQHQEAGTSMVKVRVQHPPEASVKIHHVLKVTGHSPAPGTPGGGELLVQAQTVAGEGAGAPDAGFKYCFREVVHGQCASPLPGLRSKDMCCRGIGKAWGINECVLCPRNTGQGNSSCPIGFHIVNGTQCVDVNECLQPGLCDKGICVNTRGSYSCVCKAGYILDASHGLCISQSVISEDRSQCYRVLGSGQGSSSCSLPILRNITRQICCCSRVGKAWGPHCQRCPYFGSGAFRETCPAGPGYHYSASALQINPRAEAPLLVSPGHYSTLGNHGNQGTLGNQGNQGTGTSTQTHTSNTGGRSGGSGSTRPQQKPSLSVDARASATTGSTGSVPVARTGSTDPSTRPQQPGAGGTALAQEKAPVPGRAAGAHGVGPGGQRLAAEQTHWLLLSATAGRGDSLPRPPSSGPPPGDPTTPPPSRSRVQTVRGVCETRPQLCGRGLCMDQPGGSYTCVCEKGYQPSAQKTYCQDVDECQVNPCSGGSCENSPGSFKCICRRGYRLEGTTCKDINECADPLRCPGQQCVNNPGSYRCVSCQPGYRLLDALCTDVDECRQATCTNGRCENTPGSYKCVCHHGYRLHNNNNCTDVDECVLASQCPGQMCVNSQGSYRCVSCTPGYTLTNRQCTDIDECEGVAQCPGQECVNTPGSYRCVQCRQGYRSALGQCADIDECQQSLCTNGRCDNTPGSFKCVCYHGYQLEGHTCTDVDECVLASQCPGQMCVNSQGSYRCVSCTPGYTLTNRQCTDIDECVSSAPCGERRTCVNTVGSYKCDCVPGYRTSGLGRTCRDINECAEGEFCFPRGECVNTLGSYQCVCSLGYTPSANGTSCFDVDECVRRGVCDDGVCVNTLGSYHCQCQTGFTSSPEGTACLDVDECVSGGPVCGTQRCQNTIGSFHCITSCQPGYHVTPTGGCVELPLPPETAPPPPPMALLPAARPGELRECYYNLADITTCSLLAANTTQQECCCTVGGAWGLGCLHHACPPPGSAEFLTMCPSGRGYLTTGPEAFSYKDVDECKLFQPEVCKGGLCRNNIPGYTCYCPSGYVHHTTLLECVDMDECEEDSCPRGVCVNTVGSFYCSCQHPLVLDDTQRTCINSSDLTVDQRLSLCWQHVTADLVCQSPLVGAQFSFTDCCCLYGEGWGLQCALCPAPDSEGYATLCSAVLPLPFPEGFSDPGAGAGAGAGTGAGPGLGRGPAVPYSPAVPDYGDYEDYSPAGGSRTDSSRRPGTGYYDEDYVAPDDGGTPPRTPPFLFRRLPPDPRSERAFGVRPPPPSLPVGTPLRLAPLPGSWGAPLGEEEGEGEEPWRPGPPFPPFTGRRRVGGVTGVVTPRRDYDRRYDSYAGLSTAEDCGILGGCENGRCIRITEGYTCDCYPGYELELTSMTCRDVNECEQARAVSFQCVNARCINTDGSFRCVCRRGYVMSRRPNHCVAA